MRPRLSGLNSVYPNRELYLARDAGAGESAEDFREGFDENSSGLIILCQLPGRLEHTHSQGHLIFFANRICLATFIRAAAQTLIRIMERQRATPTGEQRQPQPSRLRATMQLELPDEIFRLLGASLTSTPKESAIGMPRPPEEDELSELTLPYSPS